MHRDQAPSVADVVEVLVDEVNFDCCELSPSAELIVSPTTTLPIFPGGPRGRGAPRGGRGGRR